MKCIVCVAFEGFFLLLEKNPTGFGMRAFSITMKCLLFFISSFQNESRSPPVSCFSKQRKKYHKSLSKASRSGMCSGYIILVRILTNNKLRCVPSTVCRGIISNL